MRFCDAEGRRCASDAPGAIRHKGLSLSYYADLYPGGRRKRYALKTTDLGQAWVRLRELQKEVEDGNRGITDPYTRHAGTPLHMHVEAWVAALRDEGADQTRTETMEARLSKLAAEAGWKLLGDVTAPTCRAALGRLGQDTETRPGLAAQTRNHYLSHAKQFLRWCVADRRLRENPLVGSRPVDVSADRRHDRRSPSGEEVALLFAHLDSPAARVRLGMTGPQRRLGYSLAMATGFRAMELRSLTRESMDLDTATATVRAAYTKNGKQAVQPLPPWLVDELLAWFAAGGQCWDGFPARHPGRLLKADLLAAGVPYWTAAGYFDMHSLRAWYISQLASQPGMDLKTLMTLARHSTAQLSLAVYAKARPENLGAAVDRIGRPGGGSPDQGAVKK